MQRASGLRRAPIYYHVASAHTFIAVAHGEKVNVDTLRVEEEQADPGIRRINGHNEQYPNDPALLLRIRVPPQVLIDLQGRRQSVRSSNPNHSTTHLLAGQEERHPDEGAGYSLGRLRLQEDAIADVPQRPEGQGNTVGRVLGRRSRVHCRFEGRHQ